MNEQIKLNKQLTIQLKTTPHAIALKEFTKYTIQNPEFFNLTPEEQKKQAMEYVEKYKRVSEKLSENLSQ